MAWRLSEHPGYMLRHGDLPGFAQPDVYIRKMLKGQYCLAWQRSSPPCSQQLRMSRLEQPLVLGEEGMAVVRAVMEWEMEYPRVWRAAAHLLHKH